MKIEIQSLNFALAPAQMRYIERRVSFALAANTEQIERVELWLSEISLTEGNVFNRCLIQVQLKSKTMVVSENIDADLRVAIHRAADQASWKVPRALGLQQRYAGTSLKIPRPSIESRLEYMAQ